MDERRLWWMSDPEEFERFKSELGEFDFLEYQIENEGVVVTGSWPVSGKTKTITRYDIRIELPDDFPKSVPAVFEIGDRIDKTPDFHFNGGTLSACLFAQPQRWEKWPPGSGIKDFLNGPVKEFFFSQVYRALTGRWPFGDWSHGNEGIIEYFASKLGTGSLSELRTLIAAAIGDETQRMTLCFCGSTRTILECHGKSLPWLAKTIPAAELASALRIIDCEIARGRASVELKTQANPNALLSDT